MSKRDWLFCESKLHRYGGTSLLATAVPEPYAADEVKDYLALQVEYREKSFAAGFIPTTYTRREMGYVDVFDR